MSREARVKVGVRVSVMTVNVSLKPYISYFANVKFGLESSQM